jgi:hypothetical protein
LNIEERSKLHLKYNPNLPLEICYPPKNSSKSVCLVFVFVSFDFVCLFVCLFVSFLKKKKYFERLNKHYSIPLEHQLQPNILMLSNVEVLQRIAKFLKLFFSHRSKLEFQFQLMSLFFVVLVVVVGFSTIQSFMRVEIKIK